MLKDTSSNPASSNTSTSNSSLKEIIQKNNGRYQHLPEANIPIEMQKLKRWTAAKLVDRNGKLTKPPCNDDGYPHDAMNPANLENYSTSRPGFSLDDKDNIIVIDQDDLPENEDHADIRRELYKRFNAITYTEKSISNLLLGKAEKFHTFGYSPLITNAITCKPLGLEIYGNKRYVLTTGIGNRKALAESSVMDAELRWLLNMIDMLNGKVVSVTTSQTKPPAKFEVTREEEGRGLLDVEAALDKETICNVNLDRARNQLKHLKDLGIDFITDNTSFNWFCLTMNSEYFRMPHHEIDMWCRTQKGYDSGTLKRIESTERKAWGTRQDESFFGKVAKLLEKHKASIKLVKKDTSSSNDPRKEPLEETLPEQKPLMELVALVDVSPGFPPRGKVSVLAGKPGAGKTSLILHWASEALKNNLRVLYLSADITRVEMRPFLLAYECDESNLRIEDDLTILTPTYLNKLICLFKPDILIADSLDEFFGRMTSNFMIDNKGVEKDFDVEKSQVHSMKAFGWLIPFITKANVSMLATLHPSQHGHRLPHSAKIPAYLHRWDLLYKKGQSDMSKFPEPSLAVEFGNTDDGTRLLYNGKRRGARDAEHIFFDYTGELKKEIELHPSDKLIASPISNWREAKTKSELIKPNPYTLPPDEKIIRTIRDVGKTSFSYITRAIRISDKDTIRKELLYAKLHRLADDKKIDRKQHGKGWTWSISSK